MLHPPSLYVQSNRIRNNVVYIFRIFQLFSVVSVSSTVHTQVDNCILLGSVLVVCPLTHLTSLYFWQLYFVLTVFQAFLQFYSVRGFTHDHTS